MLGPLQGARTQAAVSPRGGRRERCRAGGECVRGPCGGLLGCVRSVRRVRSVVVWRWSGEGLRGDGRGVEPVAFRGVRSL